MIRRLLALVLCLSGSLVYAQTCPPGYVPKPYQDCIGAIPVCSPLYTAPNGLLCGSGAQWDQVRTRCGVTEHMSSWYTFQAQTSGLLAFYIIPSDVQNLTDFSAGDGWRDYDWVVYKVPADTNAQPGYLCSMVHDSAHYQFSCNYSGQKGVTGMYDRMGAAANGSSQNAGGTRFNDPLPVQQGDRFYLLVDNFRIDTVGYTIRFLAPTDSAIYADVSFRTPLAIERISYDPQCVGNCPVLLTLNRSVPCSMMDVKVYNPANLGQVFQSVASCPGNRTYSDSVWVVGDFNPVDSSLAIVFTSHDTTGLRYQCLRRTGDSDTIQLKPRRPGQYSTITDTKKLEGYTRNLLAPNPFSQEIVATLPEVCRYSVILYNELGVRVYHQEGLSGRTVLTLPTGLAPGLYSAEIAGQGKRWRQRLLRQQ